MPIQNNYWAHFLENDSYNSFSEIFIKQEYENYLPNENLNKVIDLGAHYGYFSLWLQSKSLNRKISSLLIEPSSRCYKSLTNLVAQPELMGNFFFLQGAIGSNKTESSGFYDRPFMAASLSPCSPNDPQTPVKILKEEEIHKKLSPPYDLIKCDIEGSEWELIKNYSNLLNNCKYLILEWHSWHSGGGGYKQLMNELEFLNFVEVKSSPPSPAVGRKGEVGLVLAVNQCFQN